jgi:DNA-binding XRE family transcriptional regulator
VTPAELREWRQSLGWSTATAAKELGVAWRTYKYYEQGVSSYGTPHDNAIPRIVELAVAEVARRQQEPAAQA